MTSIPAATWISNHWKSWSRRIPIIGTTLLACSALAQAPVCGTNEAVLLDRALDTLNMTRRDLAFDKDHGEPRWALPWIRNALNEPLQMATAGDALLRAVAIGPDAIWNEVAAKLEVEPAAVTQRSGTEADRAALVSSLPELAPALADFLAAARVTDELLKRAFAGLDEAEKSLLVASLFSQALKASREDVQGALLAAGVSTQAILRVMREDDELDPEPATTNFLALAARIDQPALLAAGRLFQGAAARLGRAALTVTNWPATPVQCTTPLGLLVVDGAGPLAVDQPVLLVLDRDGESFYGPRACTASGLRSAPLCAIVDLGGNDRYRGAAAGAVFGVCVVVDAGGDDTYRADFWGQGAGLFGVGWLQDESGDDRYDAATFAQGAGGCGIGVLCDEAGHDIYNLGLCGQGMAFFRGFGLLDDAAGNDRYLAGNREPDWDRNSGRYLSLAQGFSIGIRGFAGGGIGALVDRGGNDTYVADVYGQGVSYWYSAGFLIDAGGVDSYSVYQYGQGAGIHLSLGLLADLDGNDRYTGYILSQGAGHDFGVGLLFDHAGDDTYVADHHAQGRALNISLGLLCDTAGDDGYFARQNHRAQGIGNNGDTRETGSIALLVDGAGRDVYSCGATNDAAFLRPLYGVVYDAGTNAPGARGVK